MTTILSTARKSTRTINGTDFPVNVVMSRFAPRGKRPVFTAALVCNGTAITSADFRTLRECRQHAAGLYGYEGTMALRNA
jgi:hypothetical protein